MIYDDVKAQNQSKNQKKKKTKKKKVKSMKRKKLIVKKAQCIPVRSSPICWFTRHKHIKTNQSTLEVSIFYQNYTTIVYMILVAQQIIVLVNCVKFRLFFCVLNKTMGNFLVFVDGLGNSLYAGRLGDREDTFSESLLRLSNIYPSSTFSSTINRKIQRISIEIFIFSNIESGIKNQKFPK